MWLVCNLIASFNESSGAIFTGGNSSKKQNSFSKKLGQKAKNQLNYGGNSLHVVSLLFDTVKINNLRVVL